MVPRAMNLAFVGSDLSQVFVFTILLKFLSLNLRRERHLVCSCLPFCSFSHGRNYKRLDLEHNRRVRIYVGQCHRAFCY